MRGLRGIERIAWGLGLVLIAIYGGVRLHASILAQNELDRFEEAREAARPTVLETRLPVDFSLWSHKRFLAYERTLAMETDAPLAVLRIPGLDLEVPVLAGTGDLVLDRAVGHIEGTARPGEYGNIGIAGHRDGFFRGLKDIAEGDVIELETLDGAETYIVSELTVVDPDDVEVLDDTPSPSITLVTCYPFYFVGSAPQRFIVRGVRSIAVADAGP